MTTVTAPLDEALGAWVAGAMGDPSGPAWLRDLRCAAGGRFQGAGLPRRSHEGWRFTPLDRVLSARLLPDQGAALAPGPAPPAGVRVEPLSAAPDAERWLGRVAVAGGPFADANTALFRDGLRVSVEAGAVVDLPLVLDVAGPPDGALAVNPRVLVVVEEGARLRLVERHGAPGGVLTNAVTEVVVGPGASVEHVHVRRPRATGLHLGTLAVRVERDGAYVSRVVALGGRLSRLDLSVALSGPGASCALEGLYVAAADEHVDHHTVVDHLTPHTTSTQRYKGIVAGQAEAVFDGTVRIRPGAKGASAAQENRNLLLSDGAVVHTKPSLLIDADDVKATHGAAVGHLDEEAVWYLRSRGVGVAEARAMLIHAFAREILDGVEPEGLREELVGAVLARLP